MSKIAARLVLEEGDCQHRCWNLYHCAPGIRHYDCGAKVSGHKGDRIALLSLAAGGQDGS